MAITVQLLRSDGPFPGCPAYVYNLPTAITISGYNGTTGASGTAVGGTTWAIYDNDSPSGAYGSTAVASGTMLSAATSFPVSVLDNWIGGGAIEPGWYHGVINNADASAFYVVVCSSNPLGGSTNLWSITNTPSLSYQASLPSGPDIAAWCPGLPDRDLYQIPALSAAQIAANVSADAYYTTGDGVRERLVWISSSAQSASSPTTAQWAAVATALVALDPPVHAIYELPTNEPDEIPESLANIATQCNAAYAAIIAVDPLAQFAVFCSNGYGSTSFANWSTVINALTFVPKYGSTHMEATNENLADSIAQGQYTTGLKTTGLTSFLYTETGIDEAVTYSAGVFSARRGIRQRCMFRLNAELSGVSSKEQCYDFPIFDHQAASIFSYQIERWQGGFGGNFRPGLYGLHVMAEALYATSPPTALNFGPAGSPGAACFIGGHFAGTNFDTVMIMTNGVDDSVILELPGYSEGQEVTMWNGLGRASTLTVSSSHTVTAPVNDLPTYVFLLPSSTVNVAGTTNGVLELNNGVNVMPGATVKNGAGSTISLPNDSFQSSFTDVPGSSAPFSQHGTIPDTFTGTGVSGTLVGYAYRSCQSDYFSNGITVPTALTLKIDAATILSFTNTSAVNYTSRPTGDSANGTAAGCSTTEYLAEIWTFAGTISPTAISSQVSLEVSDTTYNATVTDAVGRQQINISEWQMYIAANPPGGPMRLRRFI